MAYHIKGLGKNKKIREQRKKPLPTGLMKADKDMNIKKIDNIILANNPLILFHPKGMDLCESKSVVSQKKK